MKPVTEFWKRLITVSPTMHFTNPVGIHQRLLFRLPEGQRGRYLEIGTRRGHSLACVLYRTAMTAVSVDLYIPQYAEEPNPGPDFVAAQLRLMDLDPERVTFITGDSHKVLPMIKEEFDLVLVDGDHSAAGMVDDLRQAYRLCAKDGVILVDDVDADVLPLIKKVKAPYAVDFQDFTADTLRPFVEIRRC